MSERLSTGVPEIDREIGGGIDPGSIVLVAAPPASQSEALLHATMRERRTRYVTTRRNENAVSETLRKVLDDGPGYSVKYAGLDEPLANVREAIALVESEAGIVVDTVDPLERTGDSDSYVTFLNELKDALIETGSVGVLHAAVGGERAPLRDVTEAFADLVLEVEVQRNGSQVEHVLSVPKFRAHDLPGETIKLELSSEVDVDTSRDIA